MLSNQTQSNLGWLKTFMMPLFLPHPDVIDPVQRRTACLMAIFHFSMLPMGPLAAFVLNYTTPHHVPFGSAWVILVTLTTLGNYVLARSRFYRVAIYAQVVAAFLACLFTAFQVPHRQSVHFLLVLLPVLMAAYLMSFRELLVVAAAALSGLVCLYVSAEPEAQRLIAGSLFGLLVLTILTILVRSHYNWVERTRRLMLEFELERFQSLMQAAYESVVTVKNGRIHSVSGSSEFLFGRAVEELHDRHLLSLVTLDDIRTPHFGETSFARPDGSVGFTLYAVEPLPGDVALVAFRDVTEERLSTVRRLQLDRLAQTATLAAGIAHEFNTPLMVVMHQLERVQQSISSHDDESKQILGSAQAGLKQLGSVIKDLKWFIEPSTMATCVSPSDVVVNSVRIANHRIRHQSELIVGDILDRPIAVSDSQLMQLLLNLIFNANEAKKEELSRCRIELSTQVANEHYCFTVSDNGVGMPEDVLSRALQPFFTRGKLNGTGLGLAICKSILDQVDGRIQIDSTEGEGTSVTIQIPLARAPHRAQTVAELPEEQIEQSGLVIDDDALLGQLVAEMFDANEASSVTAIDDAIELIEAAQVAFILCDLNMPLGGAIELYDYLRQRGNHLVDRMIIMTGGAVDPEAQAFLKRTNMPILYKPFGQTELLEAIATLKSSRN